VTQADVDYVGSIEIDEGLMEAADLITNEQVHIWNVTNGERFLTYVIPGPRGSGRICINGRARKAAAGTWSSSPPSPSLPTPKPRPGNPASSSSIPRTDHPTSAWPSAARMKPSDCRAPAGGAFFSAATIRRSGA